jgi:Leucine rich repeat
MKITSVLSVFLVILNGSQQSTITKINCQVEKQNYLKCTNQKPNQPIDGFPFVNQVGFNWKNFQELRLTRNQIRSYGNGTFAKFTNVERIHLDDNNLYAIDFNEFRSNLKLTNIDLGYNKITKIHKIQESSNVSITNLQMHNNDLTDISELCKLRKLKELNLSRNRRLDFGKVMFNCWSELINLFLTETNMKHLNHDYRMLDGCNKLDYLNLMDNNLGILCFQRFPEFPGLTHLNIRNNSLINLNVQGLKVKLQNLLKITTTGNEWTCDYFQTNLTQQLNDFNITEYPNSAPFHEKKCSDIVNPVVEECPKFDESTGRFISISFWIIFLLDCVLCIIVFVLLMNYEF